jgi:hypothetical protein
MLLLPFQHPTTPSIQIQLEIMHPANFKKNNKKYLKNAMLLSSE